MADEFIFAPEQRPDTINWLYLVVLLFCGLCAIFFLFFFNRLLATLISYAIRAYTWRKHNAYVDIRTIQISPLGGRIFFKDVRYHAHNLTILVHGGYITWNYWLRNVQEAEVFQETENTRKARGEKPKGDDGQKSNRSGSLGREERGGGKAKNKLPCRITIKISGLEVFLYNRSPVYDTLVENVTKISKNQRQRDNDSDGDSSDENQGYQSLSLSRQLDEVGDSVILSPSDPPKWLRVFPIHVECSKGAIAVGNEFTTSVLTVQFEKAGGEFNAGRPGRLDVYRQLFNFDFTRLLIHMKPNTDFKTTHLAAAMQIKKDGYLAEESTAKEHTNRSRKHKGMNALRYLSNFVNRSANSINVGANSKNGMGFGEQTSFPGQERWLGLSRYLEETNDEHDEWEGVEYAKTTLIVDSPRLAMSFYWDVGGPVSAAAAVAARHSASGEINGADPPAYGLDLFVYGGTINYGPWADRQRANLQSFFVPASYVDAIPAEPIKCGQTRVSSEFKIFISVEEETIMRIPIKEPSKDWKWKGKAQDIPGYGKKAGEKLKNRGSERRKSSWLKRTPKNVQGTNPRPFAWLDVKVSGNSTVNYIMDMFARPDGYHNRLDLDVQSLEIYTSVNHGLLWRSGRLALDCNLSNPLGWSALRNWTFKVSNSDLELFILRDHLFLLIDLIADWGSGPLAEFFTFVPYIYALDVRFENLKLYLNANDSNIINNPSDLDDNNFMIIAGELLTAETLIPLDKFRPALNEIPFDVHGKNFSLSLRLPPRNTVHTFLKSKTLATLENLHFKGSHTYYSETRQGLTDTLHFDVYGSKFFLTLFGFLIDHFMKVKENYFGEDLHFSTLEEFQGLQRNSATGAIEKGEEHFKKTNDLDVILTIKVEDAGGVLPGGLYSAEKGSKVEVPFANADLRFTNYYMDLGVNLSPVSISLMKALESPHEVESYNKTEVFIESVDVYGHRLFGLPPAEPTYVCHWDFDIGKIYGECSLELLHVLASGGRYFAFTLDDDENALRAVPLPIIHDVTYLRLKASGANVWLHIADEALQLSCGQIEVNFNDLADDIFSQRLNVLIPNITVACVDVEKAFRRSHEENQRRSAKTYAYLNTNLTLNMVRRKVDFENEKQKQQDHLAFHDRRTGRTDFLLSGPPGRSLHQSTLTQGALSAPAMPFPPMPRPIIQDDFSRASSLESSIRTSSSRRRAKATGRAASFAASLHSLASSSSSSMFRGNLTELGSGTEQEGGTVLDAHEFALTGNPPNLKDIQDLKPTPKPSISVATSSPLAKPSFNLQGIVADVNDVPVFPKADYPLKRSDYSRVDSRNFQDGYFKDNSSYMSFIIQAKPGIRGFCAPQAITAISNIIAAFNTTSPGDIVDVLHASVMGEILDFQKKKEGEGKSVEVNLKIPFCHIRFCNSSKDRDLSMPAVGDQYNLIIKELNTNLRLKELPKKGGYDENITFHTSLESVLLNVKETRDQLVADRASIKMHINDILVWAASATETFVNISFKDLGVFSLSKDLAYIDSMIMRAIHLVEELQPIFEDLDKTSTLSRAYVGYFLTLAGAKTPDPIFLSRPSYGVRAASEHLRMHDSWKVISRLRSIYQSLQPDKRKELESACSKSKFPVPVAKEADDALSFWDKWRSWDVADIRKSRAMQWLFGETTTLKEEPETPRKPIHIDMKSRSIGIVLDPGSKQTELKSQLLSIHMSHRPASGPSGLMLVESNSTIASSLLEVTSQSLLVNINFDVIGMVEAAWDIIETKQSRPRNTPSKEKPKPPSLKEKKTDLQNVQALVVVENTDVILESKNVRLSSMSRGFKMSLVANPGSLIEGGTTITGLMHANVLGIDMRTLSRHLMHSYFDAPKLYFSKSVEKTKDESSDHWNIAGMSQKLSTGIVEEPLGLIEVMNDVILDEGDRVLKAKDYISARRTIEPDQPTEKESDLVLPSVTLSSFLDAFAFDAVILPNLAYSISGKTGRISVSPSLKARETKFHVNYDLESHTHGLFNAKGQPGNALTTFKFPAINGKLTFERGKSQHSLETSCAMETVVLELSAVHALHNIIGRPEISETGRAIKRDLSLVQSNLRELMTSKSRYIDPRPKAVAAKDTPLAFSAAIFFSGLKIVAKAPTGEIPKQYAHFTFMLNDTHIKASNLSQDGKRLLRFPDVNIDLGHIGAAMTLYHNGKTQRCGSLGFAFVLDCTSIDDGAGGVRPKYGAYSRGLLVDVYAETASAVASVINHLQDRIKSFDLEREKRYFRKLRQSRKSPAIPRITLTEDDSSGDQAINLLKSAISLELLNIQLSWIVSTADIPDQQYPTEDLVLSCRSINLSTRTEDSARLIIDNTQLQIVPQTFVDKTQRSGNSILLPQVVFNVAYASTRDDLRLAFHAAGKAFDIMLDSRFVIPASMVQQSMALAASKFRSVTANWKPSEEPSKPVDDDKKDQKHPFGNRKLSSLLIDAEFAGAVVYVQANPNHSPAKSLHNTLISKAGAQGRKDQLGAESVNPTASLQAPGVALKVEFKKNNGDPSLTSELKIEPSSNTLYPTVVPIIVDITNSIKEVVKDDDDAEEEAAKEETGAEISEKPQEGDNIITADPTALLGGMRLNFGLRICKQEFSLSCQPIARVAATAYFKDIYVTVNSVNSTDHGNFFAVSGLIDRPQMSVKHVYSTESTFSFEIDAIMLSLLNSKHLSGTSGISAILKIDPARTLMNVRQLQDFLLFREIWLPPEIRHVSKPPSSRQQQPQTQDHLVQKYQQVTSAAAFPWTVTVSLAQVFVELDLGQALGTTSLIISDLWASSKKNSDWEQNLCVGLGSVRVESIGRLSGFVDLSALKVRTSIRWPLAMEGYRQTPLIQASVSFGGLRLKTAFDQQVFAIAEISGFAFLMYNVRDDSSGQSDRLVAVLDGDKVYAFATATSASHALALHQAIEKLFQETSASYSQSLQDIEKSLRRTTLMSARKASSQSIETVAKPKKKDKQDSPISLHTDVVVNLKSLKVGAFPGTFYDSQMFSAEASDVQATFAVAVEEDQKLHTALGMTLGRFTVALTAMTQSKISRAANDLNVDEVIKNALSARGGTILRVPKVNASMQTWHNYDSSHIEYIFKSLFEGKIDVGWNYSRISFIRSMYNNHSRALAMRLGKPPPEPAVKITAPDQPSADDGKPGEGGKITAVVNVPQSKYDYTALEPPIIATPQLRDMGEATPPLEWIGLNRDRLPNITHQIVIVSLLEIAKEVEDAYGRILGAS